MENIQRDLEKEIAALQSSKPTRKNRRWTLLFVGDHGKVVTIRWFRWMVTLGVFLLVMAVLASAILYYLYRHTRDMNVSLQRSLDNLHQQIAGFREDKEVLMTRLVVAETERERLRARLDPKPVVKAPDDRLEARGKEQPRPNSQVVRQSGAAVSEPGEKLISNADPDDSIAQENDPKVSIEEFNVSYETASNTFRAQYVIRNTGPDSSPVSGYTAIILKKLDTQPDEWLTLPTLKLAAGIPTGGKKGQYFSIFRFKTVKFMVKSKMDPLQFDTATVYVFDENKNLLLEKNFAINIQESVFTPNS
jgi:regulator of replication initiation timing